LMFCNFCCFSYLWWIFTTMTLLLKLFLSIIDDVQLFDINYVLHVIGELSSFFGIFLDEWDISTTK
jgi:hypothetical protein